MQPIAEYLLSGPSGLEDPSEVTEEVRGLIVEAVRAARASPPPGDPGQRLAAYARRGDLAAVTSLLDEGVHPDGRTPSGSTALAGALACRHDEVAALLVARGADLELAKTFERALKAALRSRLWQAAAAMIARGARPDTGDLISVLLWGPIGLVGAIAAIVQISDAIGSLANHPAFYDRLENDAELARLVGEKHGSLPERPLPPRKWSGRVPRASLRAAALEAAERNKKP